MQTVKEKLQQIFESEAPLKHATYQYVENEKDADAIAWVFVNHHKMVKYPLKFPELQPYECRVEVLYSGLCHTDWVFAEGKWGGQAHPICVGHEVVGKVTAVGSEVKDLVVGDRVGLGGLRKNCEKCDFCQQGFENLCQGDVDQKLPMGPKFWGGYATHVQHPAQWLFKIPPGIPDDKAASLMCAGVSCYAPLARKAKSGDKVAVIGMGGLGHLGLKIAKAMGCEATAFTTHEDKIELLKGLGADKVVKTSDETLKQEIGKYNIVLNTLPVATEFFDGLLGLTRPLGTFCQVGVTFEALKTSSITLVLNQIDIHGSLFGSRQEVRDTLDFCEKHQIFPDYEYFEFEQFPEAYHKMVHGVPHFRNVVKVKGTVKKE